MRKMAPSRYLRKPLPSRQGVVLRMRPGELHTSSHMPPRALAKVRNPTHRFQVGVARSHCQRGNDAEFPYTDERKRVFGSSARCPTAVSHRKEDVKHQRCEMQLSVISLKPLARSSGSRLDEALALRREVFSLKQRSFRRNRARNFCRGRQKWRAVFCEIPVCLR